MTFSKAKICIICLKFANKLCFYLLSGVRRARNFSVWLSFCLHEKMNFIWKTSSEKQNSRKDCHSSSSYNLGIPALYLKFSFSAYNFADIQKIWMKKSLVVEVQFMKISSLILRIGHARKNDFSFEVTRLWTSRQCYLNWWLGTNSRQFEEKLVSMDLS